LLSAFIRDFLAAKVHKEHMALPSRGDNSFANPVLLLGYRFLFILFILSENRKSPFLG
jgi:hypothetical protein